ncbi:MAG TPA: hypothetical protein VGW76_08255 [Pyrinomonadaceae bacterium]|nr:hypothetical protein [Pyrinomonadaceae bacterium]
MSIDPRQRTWELAQTDVDAALRFARHIEGNWYRCQALAAVAWHTKRKGDFLKIVNEGLETASVIPDVYQAVACSAWVVRAMAQREDVDIFPVVKELLQIIKREPNPVCQADALLLLFEAIYRKCELRKVVLSPLLQACEEMKSWKKPRTLKDIALILAVDDLASANEVVEMIQKKSIKQQAKVAIEKREWLGAHEFLPYYAKTAS